MPRCAVPGCHTYDRFAKTVGISLYRFPKNKSICEQWLKRIKNKELSEKGIGTKRVCSLHFKQKDFYKGKKKKGTVPYIFSRPTYFYLVSFFILSSTIHIYICTSIVYR